MAPDPHHRRIAAHPHRVPLPYKTFAVRSDEVCHAQLARAPYGWLHRVATRFLDPGSLAGLVALGYGRVNIDEFADVDYAPTDLAELAAVAPGLAGLAGALADALRLTAVLGDALGPYQVAVSTRIDFLAARGAGFHNDVGRHWSRCLFWVLALDLSDVELVMPHAGVRLPLAPGDLVVFDPTMAHGLCRPRDQGLALAASFEGRAQDRQLFLTGELLLSDEQWAALGSPWLGVEVHARQGALDLLVAEFDDRSGAIQRLTALRDSMSPTVCHADPRPQLCP